MKQGNIINNIGCLRPGPNKGKYVCIDPGQKIECDTDQDRAQKRFQYSNLALFEIDPLEFTQDVQNKSKKENKLKKQINDLEQIKECFTINDNISRDGRGQQHAEKKIIHNGEELNLIGNVGCQGQRHIGIGGPP